MARADLAYAGAHLLSNPTKAFQNQTKAKFAALASYRNYHQGRGPGARDRRAAQKPLWIVDISAALEEAAPFCHGLDLCSFVRPRPRGCDPLVT